MAVGGDWIGDFTDGWPDVPPPAPAPAAGGARETVEIVICPRCRVRDVRCTKRQATHSNWACEKCFHGWKEGPTTGTTRASIA